MNDVPRQPISCWRAGLPARRRSGPAAALCGLGRARGARTAAPSAAGPGLCREHLPGRSGGCSVVSPAVPVELPGRSQLLATRAEAAGPPAPGEEPSQAPRGSPLGPVAAVLRRPRAASRAGRATRPPPAASAPTSLTWAGARGHLGPRQGPNGARGAAGGTGEALRGGGGRVPVQRHRRRSASRGRSNPALPRLLCACAVPRPPLPSPPSTSRRGACALLHTGPHGAARMRTAPARPLPPRRTPPERGDAERGRALLSGPRPGGAPGGSPDRCRPPEPRGATGPEPASGAEVRGGAGRAVSDKRLSQWERPSAGHAPTGRCWRLIGCGEGWGAGLAAGLVRGPRERPGTGVRGGEGTERANPNPSPNPNLNPNSNPK